MLDISRREFITLFGGAAASVSLPHVVRAQQPAMPVIGFLHGASPERYVPMVTALRQGLKEAGYVDGRNLAIEFRWAEGHYDRLPTLAADLVHHAIAAIVAAPTPAALAAKAATATIPIVFLTGGDPIKLGLAASLSRPGGNATGVAIFTAMLAAKRVELLHELVPQATVIAVLVNPTNPSLAESTVNDAAVAARALGLELHVVNAGSQGELDLAFATLIKQRAGGLIVGADAFFNSQRELIVALAARHAVPTIYDGREFTAAGGLVSYAPRLADEYHLTGIYAGKILNGAKPTDLPIQLSTRVELVINLKTANSLGITVPLPLLGRAEEVIE
jgi:putative tryptophan/tyrosine transport system substrate-binding protein